MQGLRYTLVGDGAKEPNGPPQHPITCGRRRCRYGSYPSLKPAVKVHTAMRIIRPPGVFSKDRRFTYTWHTHRNSMVIHVAYSYVLTGGALVRVCDAIVHLPAGEGRVVVRRPVIPMKRTRKSGANSTTPGAAAGDAPDDVRASPQIPLADSGGDRAVASGKPPARRQGRADPSSSGKAAIVIRGDQLQGDPAKFGAVDEIGRPVAVQAVEAAGQGGPSPTTPAAALAGGSRCNPARVGTTA